MDSVNQIRIVDEMAETVRDSLVTLIAAGRVPESWDGHELRRWFIDKAAETIASNMPTARVRQYKNARLARNL
jgi:DNA-binding TFAR19-related protein (PDSD5 family)